MSHNVVAENSAAGTVIGRLNTIDPDVADTHTYLLLDNAGGRFKLVGNQLQVAPGAVLDYESASIVIDGKGAATGDYRFVLNNLAALPPLTFNTPIADTVETTKQVQLYRLSGSVGQTLAFDLAASTWNGATWVLYGTNNQVLASPTTTAPDFRVTLPATGAYHLAVHRTASSAVNYTFTVTDHTPAPVPTTGLDVLVGETTFSDRQGSLGLGQVVTQTFSAAAGTRIYFDSKNAANGNVRITVFNPDGTAVLSTLAATDVGPVQLSQTGAYTIRIEGASATSSGNYHFSYQFVELELHIPRADPPQSPLRRGKPQAGDLDL